jgi:hypothetical protein
VKTGERGTLALVHLAMAIVRTVGQLARAIIQPTTCSLPRGMVPMGVMGVVGMIRARWEGGGGGGEGGGGEGSARTNGKTDSGKRAWMSIPLAQHELM